MRVGSQDPESIVFPSEGLNGGPLGHVPDSDRFVFTVREDQFVPRVEKRNGYIVEVTSTGVDFPCLGIAHTPKLDLSIIAARDDQWQSRMERCPVDSPIVAFENVLDDCIGVAKEIRLSLVCSLHLFLHAHRCRVSLILLSETRDIPNSDGQIHGSGNDQVFGRVELGRHDVVIVAGQDGDTRSRLPVPNSDGLIVGTGQNPGVFAVEEGCSDIVQV